LPQFKKNLSELQTIQDKWFYAFRHLAELDDIPSVLQEAVFLQLFEAAKIAKFTTIERQAYEDSLKYYRDLKNVTDTARDEGVEQGIEIGKEQGIEIGKEIGKEEGIAIGEKKGKEQGKAEAIELAVIGMHKAGLSVEMIAKTLLLEEAFIVELLTVKE
jgi:predicted transposase YdaD